MRRTTGWEKVGIAGVLAWLWRGPLMVVILVMIAVLGLAMVVAPGVAVMVMLAVGCALTARHLLGRN